MVKECEAPVGVPVMAASTAPAESCRYAVKVLFRQPAAMPEIVTWLDVAPVAVVVESHTGDGSAHAATEKTCGCSGVRMSSCAAAAGLTPMPMLTSRAETNAVTQAPMPAFAAPGPGAGARAGWSASSA